MVRLYKWGDDVPSWMVKVTAGYMPSVKFGGLVFVYKWKGKYIVKLIFGKCLIKVCNGAQVNLDFNNIVMKQMTTPLSALIRIKFKFTRR